MISRRAQFIAVFRSDIVIYPLHLGKSNAMKFKIDEQIFKKFPNFMCGVVVCKGVKNVGTDEELLQKIKSAEESNRQEFVNE